MHSCCCTLMMNKAHIIYLYSYLNVRIYTHTYCCMLLPRAQEDFILCKCVVERASETTTYISATASSYSA